MSGICGIWRLDGAAPAGIGAMVAHLHRRGPEAQRIRREGALAFGHTLLGTTPEAALEAQPLIHAATGCLLTADLRLDNREDLIAALAPGRAGIGDGELVLLAWLRWGEDCPQHLAGDFAFAVFDPRAQRLFAARDRMGLKQLIWSHSPGRVFAFASEPGAVVCAEGIPRRLNEGRVGDFLVDHLEAIDLTSTFFEDVFRLPPAHSLRLDAKGGEIRRYWRLEPPAPLKLGSDADYAAAFRDVLDRATARRLRAPPGRVGSMLSGRMDSGSIVALAARRFAQEGRGPFPTFSAVGSGLVLVHSQNKTVAASMMAEKKVSGHRSYRVATRRQSFSLPNMISMRLRRL